MTKTIQGNFKPLEFNTRADLKETFGRYSGEAAFVLNYYLAGDGGGGPKRYWSEGQAIGFYVDNGGSVTVPTGGDGSAAWLWSYVGPVNPLWFGAKGDGSTNDTSTVQAAITYSLSVYFPQTSNSFLVDKLTLLENGIYSGEGALTGNTGSASLFDIPQGANNITIDGLTLVYPSVTGDFGHYTIQVGIDSVVDEVTTKITIKNCSITGLVQFWRCEDSVIQNNTITDGLVDIRGSYNNITISNNKIYNESGTLFNAISGSNLDATPTNRGRMIITDNHIKTYVMGVEWRDWINNDITAQNNTRNIISNNTIRVFGSNVNSFGISLNAGGFNVSNNTIERDSPLDLGWGVEAVATTKNVITGNIVSGFKYGISVYSDLPATPALYNVVSNNFVKDCKVGIGTWKYARNNTVSDNIVIIPSLYTDADIHTGIQLDGELGTAGNVTKLASNNICTGNQVYFDAGGETYAQVPSMIRVRASTDALVSGNKMVFATTGTISSSSFNAISVIDCDGINITDNVFENLTDGGVGSGIRVSNNSGRNVKITGNMFINLNTGLADQFTVKPHYSIMIADNMSRNCTNPDDTFPSSYFSSSGVSKIAYAAAAPTEGTWGDGDVVLNTTAAVGWKCTVAGTSGTADATTAATTAASTTVTPSTLRQLEEGQLITIVGVTGNKTITSVDNVAGTFEIDVAADATVAAGAIAYVNPTFAALPF